MRSERTEPVMSGEVAFLAPRATVPERTRRTPEGRACRSEVVAAVRVA
ncbi:MAG: hypothetical protein WCH74_07260 [Chloroflexota bacterium]